MFKNKPWFAHVTLLAPLGLWLAGCASPAPAPQPRPAPPPVVAAPVSVPATPEPAAVVRPDYPQRYVVVKGDTLWDIAARFLKDPWLWPEIWQINPAIHNPHLIYPGDVITLHFVNGKPVLSVQRGHNAPRGLKTEKLEPRVRVESLGRAINTIPMSVIRPYLVLPHVVTRQELETAPYVVSSYGDHLITATGNRIYVRGIKDPSIGAYDIVRPGKPYKDAETGEILGYQALQLADARVIRQGDPATLEITKSKLEVLIGDRLLPAVQAPDAFHFLPRAPKARVSGHIIAVLNGVSQIGQYAVVVLDRGMRNGLEAGSVLAIYQTGETVRDQVKGGEVKLPDERAGTLMVFRSFPKVSFALVMSTTRALHVGDRITNP